MRENNSGGTVKIEVIIAENGKPIRACAKEGPFGSYLSCVQTVMQQTFEPVVVDGKPVKAKFPYVMDVRTTTFTTETTTTRPLY